MPQSDISIVMITRNRRDVTLRSVKRLKALPEQPKLIVVDNGSTDETIAALTPIPGTTVIAAGENLGAAGRTVGVQAATTRYVAFADDDSWWAPGALTAAGQAFDRYPSAGLLTGRTLIGPDEREDPINTLLAAGPFGTPPDAPGPLVVGFLACAAVVRRSAYLQVGGFHRHYGVGGEEHLLALDLLAAGWLLSYVPELVVHHHPAADPYRTQRPARQRRNDLWTAWLRRHRRQAVDSTVQSLRRAAVDAVERQALAQALRGLPWVLRERRPLPANLERLLTGSTKPAVSTAV